jgi:hypothetical protein
MGKEPSVKVAYVKLRTPFKVENSPLLYCIDAVGRFRWTSEAGHPNMCYHNFLIRC